MKSLIMCLAIFKNCLVSCCLVHSSFSLCSSSVVSVSSRLFRSSSSMNVFSGSCSVLCLILIHLSHIPFTRLPLLIFVFAMMLCFGPCSFVTFCMVGMILWNHSFGREYLFGCYHGDWAVHSLVCDTFFIYVVLFVSVLFLCRSDVCLSFCTRMAGFAVLGWCGNCHLPPMPLFHCYACCFFPWCFP